MTTSVLPIACAINADYALPLLVMLTSLKEHLRPSYRIRLFLLHQGLSQDVLCAISKLADLCPVVPGAERTSALPRHPHFPPEAAYPLLLPELLPESMDRILFLDADLLVLDDLGLLWELPLEDRALAAAPDASIPLCRSRRGVKNPEALGIPRHAVYFNCGVMLMNLQAWRSNDVKRRACGYLKETGTQADFLHQEALNAILWDDWQPLDRRWNLLGGQAGRSYDQPPSDHWKNPGIVHFAGRFKPWRAQVGGPFNPHYCASLAKATRILPAIEPTLRDRLLGVYDRYFRDSFFVCERALWNRRLL